MITDMELWSIYKKYAYKKCDYLCEDLASSMYLEALEIEKKRGLLRFNCTVKYLFLNAMKKFTKHRETDITAVAEIVSIDDYETWLMSNWEYFTCRNNGQGKKYQKYKITADTVTIELYGSEVRELLDKNHIKLSDSNIVSNLRKRGKTHYLVDDKYFKTTDNACKYFGCKNLEQLRNKHNIRKIKLGVV